MNEDYLGPDTGAFSEISECYLDKEGLFLYISLLTGRRY
jgi:hypothetical protein